MNCALILSFCWPKNLKIIWKFSLSQYRCHKTPIDVENCVKSALNSNHIKQNFTVITNWGGGDYQLRSVLAAKQIWVAVITIWGTLDSLPPCTASRAWYLCEGGMTILIRGFESNSFSRRYTNLVEFVVFALVNLRCFLTLYSCSTLSCTLSKTEVSIFFSSILPVLKLSQDLTICRALSSVCAFSRSSWSIRILPLKVPY